MNDDMTLSAVRDCLSETRDDLGAANINIPASAIIARTRSGHRARRGRQRRRLQGRFRGNAGNGRQPRPRAARASCAPGALPSGRRPGDRARAAQALACHATVSWMLHDHDLAA